MDWKSVLAAKSFWLVNLAALAGKTKLSWTGTGTTLPCQFFASLHRLSTPAPLQVRVAGARRCSSNSSRSRAFGSRPERRLQDLDEDDCRLSHCRQPVKNMMDPLSHWNARKNNKVYGHNMPAEKQPFVLRTELAAQPNPHRPRGRWIGCQRRFTTCSGEMFLALPLLASRE